MDTRHFQILRTKIIAMALSFSLLPLFVLGLTVYYQFSEAYWNKIVESARTLAQNRRDTLELFLRERIAQLYTIAHSDSFALLADEAYLEKVFNTMQSHSKSFIDLGIIDAEGNHVAYVGPHYKKLKPVNYAEESWFHRSVSSGVYVSDVFLGFRKTPHFVIAVTAGHGSRIWILRATINSDIIESIVRLGQVGKRGDAFLINTANVLQTQSRFSGEILTQRAVPDFSSTISTVVERQRFRGEEFIYAASPLTNPKWILVIKEDPHELLAPLFRARYLGGGVLALGIIVVVVGTILTTRSMTNELIRIQREKAASDDLLMQSGKMAALGKMAAGVAHEINNPLQIVSENAGRMLDLLAKKDVAGIPDFKEFQNCIKKIDRQVERCRDVTHRMLRFGRRMDPTYEVVNINYILQETITFLENEAFHRDIALTVSFDEDLPEVTTDASQLQQVFLNIIDNAIDAVGQSGKVEIRTGSTMNERAGVIIEISDNGPGIPQHLVAKVFDPLFTTKAANAGTGLGLSISHSIMDKLGGRITVDSEEGEGSTFTIFVPTVPNVSVFDERKKERTPKAFSSETG